MKKFLGNSLAIIFMCTFSIGASAGSYSISECTESSTAKRSCTRRAGGGSCSISDNGTDVTIGGNTYSGYITRPYFLTNTSDNSLNFGGLNRGRLHRDISSNAIVGATVFVNHDSLGRSFTQYSCHVGQKQRRKRVAELTDEEQIFGGNAAATAE